MSSAMVSESTEGITQLDNGAGLFDEVVEVLLSKANTSGSMEDIDP